ncbi:MAG: hypothetical protein ACRD8A_20060 [Candidatus Acidiferrales bacterium]
MPQSIMVFDFGASEETAQQARHKFDSWKQAFRLGDKAVLKFERKSDSEAASGSESDAESKPEKTTKAAKPTKSAAKKGAKKESGETEAAKKSEEDVAENSDVRVLIRLSFSDHEKLSYQRWLDRIPSEEPFKSAKGETIRHSDASFAKTADRFDSLD